MKRGHEQTQDLYFRGPEGLSLFKITPQKASTFFAPRGVRWWYWVSKVLLCQYILKKKGEIWWGVTNHSLTDYSATQLVGVGDACFLAP